jgi:hypothetical protein
VNEGLIGDYNRSGIVDAGDYTEWRSTLGRAVPPFTGADGNGNGLIDNADYNIWKANFGSTLSAVTPITAGATKGAMALPSAAKFASRYRVNSDDRWPSLAAAVIHDNVLVEWATSRIVRSRRPLDFVDFDNDRSIFENHDVIDLAFASIRRNISIHASRIPRL